MLQELVDLRETVERLQSAYDAARAQIEFDYNCRPELVMTAEGRYILLDALTALTNARVALANAALATR